MDKKISSEKEFLMKQKKISRKKTGKKNILVQKKKMVKKKLANKFSRGLFLYW